MQFAGSASISRPMATPHLSAPSVSAVSDTTATASNTFWVPFGTHGASYMWAVGLASVPGWFEYPDGADSASQAGPPVQSTP